MAKPTICYDNMLRDAATVITDPGSASGFPISNLYDHKSFTYWKSSVVTSPIILDFDTGAATENNADYLALVNHNLKTLGATVEVKSGATHPPANVRLAAVAPSEDLVTLKLFSAPGTQRYWRVTIAHASPPFAAAPFVGELLLGMKTLLPEYLPSSFDPFISGEIESKGSGSEGGHCLGELMRGKVYRGQLTQGAAGASRAEWTSTILPFLNNHALKRLPFVFAVDTDDSDFAAARWMKFRSGPHVERVAVARTWARMGLKANIEEAWKEPVA
jgi:hypothetical protein